MQSATEQVGSLLQLLREAFADPLGSGACRAEERSSGPRAPLGQFLLGCFNCNSVKGRKDVSDDDVLWPDQHNTNLAIEYSSGGFVRASNRLDDGLSRRAGGLIELVGLDRHGARGWPSPTARDQRWPQREEVWAAAERCRSDFESLGVSDEAIGLVLEAAKGYGFFSVWMTVFGGHAAVRRALIEGFPGTAHSCFNDEGEAVRRPGAIL